MRSLTQFAAAAAVFLLAAGCRVPERKPTGEEAQTQPADSVSEAPTPSPSASASPSPSPAGDREPLPDWSGSGVTNRGDSTFRMWDHLDGNDTDGGDYGDDPEWSEEEVDGASSDAAPLPPESVEGTPAEELTEEPVLSPEATDEGNEDPAVEREVPLTNDEPMVDPPIGGGGGVGGGGADEKADARDSSTLGWLARHQDSDGKWDADGWQRHVEAVHTDDAEILAAFEAARKGQGAADADTFVTALAVQAFLMAGQTSKDGDHKATVRKGLKYLIEQQHSDGCFASKEDLKNSDHLVTHALALTAFAECYGMTGSRVFEDPAQRAVDFLASRQVKGLGWGRVKANDKGALVAVGSCNTRTTCYAMLALRSARLAELKVPDACSEGALAWLELVTDKAYGTVSYSAKVGEIDAEPAPAADPKHAAHPALTAMAIYTRLMCGVKREETILKAGASLLLKDLPSRGGDPETADAEYWYWGSQAMFQMGDRYWARWNTARADALNPAIHSDADGDLAGSVDAAADARGAYGGRVYTTAMAQLSRMTMTVYEWPPTPPSDK